MRMYNSAFGVIVMISDLAEAAGGKDASWRGIFFVLGNGSLRGYDKEGMAIIAVPRTEPSRPPPLLMLALRGILLSVFSQPKWV